MLDGPAQAERDRRLRDRGEGEGVTFALVDPMVRHWLWGFDAKTLAADLWDAYVTGSRGVGEDVGLENVLAARATKDKGA